MDFCKDCGGVLNLFEKNTSGLCSSCIQHSKKNVTTAPVGASESDADILLDTFISYENGKIIISSKEGWQLWSGPGDKKTEMATILKSARLIYKIRSKRKNNK